MTVPLRLQIGLQGKCASRAKDPKSPDTSISKGTLTGAFRAAGSVIHVLDCVISGRNRNAYQHQDDIYYTMNYNNAFITNNFLMTLLQSSAEIRKCSDFGQITYVWL